MYKILTLNKISDSGLASIKNENYQITSEEKNPDGIILRSFAMHDMELPKSLLAVARAGAGVNNIPLDKCAEAGIVVFNTPGANANAVKEMVVAGMLMSNRKVVDGINWAQTLKGQGDVAKMVEKGKGDFAGGELYGKKLGVIGLGAIGVLVANAAVSLGMDVVGVDPYISVEGAWSISRSVGRAADFDEIYKDCDYITIHVPFNDATKSMINAEAISKMKKGVRIMNFSRGEIVDNAAIIKAVKDGTVARYVTDFPVDELLGIENIITIPHLAASTPEAEENCAVMASRQLKDFLETGNIKNSVNFPNCEMPYTGKKRLCIVHKNIPNIIGPLTTAPANKGINIGNMISKSKGDFAYTMLDIDDEDNGVSEELKNVAGVISVRAI